MPVAPVAQSVRTPHWWVHARAEQGTVRADMQDSFAVVQDFRLGGHAFDAVAVFDGVGGMPHGGDASKTAAEALPKLLAEGVGAHKLLDRLDEAVRKTGGATTAVVALLPHDGGRGWILSAGDSSAYAVAEDGRAARLNPLDAAHGNITQCLGLGRLKGHTISWTPPAGAIILLCTDGVDGVVAPGLLSQSLRAVSGRGPVALEALFMAIRMAGSPDNATAILARRLQ